MIVPVSFDSLWEYFPSHVNFVLSFCLFLRERVRFIWRKIKKVSEKLKTCKKFIIFLFIVAILRLIGRNIVQFFARIFRGVGYLKDHVLIPVSILQNAKPNKGTLYFAPYYRSTAVNRSSCGFSGFSYRGRIASAINGSGIGMSSIFRFTQLPHRDNRSLLVYLLNTFR